MKIIDVHEFAKFTSDKLYRELLFDSPNMRVLNFNFEPGQKLPVHSHPVESDVAIMVLEGEGAFLGGPKDVPAKAGHILICPVSQPHGFKAKTRARLLVFIAPTL